MFSSFFMFASYIGSIGLRFRWIAFTVQLAVYCPPATAGEPETFEPLGRNGAPQTFSQLWAGYDPRAEPLEAETLLEWTEDEVVLRIVRFRIGVFGGQTATLAGIYGFPKSTLSENDGDRRKVPGLLQIHGGGQYADYRACLTNAKRGYATLSIAWAGRISAPSYRVTPSEVKLFWEKRTEEPSYRLTTDWGVLDGYHAPGRNAGNHFPSLEPAEWTLDPVASPRNSGWFLCSLASRRALTFLENQPEVDGSRLGVYGHSMGGKLTVMTAFDDRVKAAAPSCGGISDRDNESELFRNTLGDAASLPNIDCPIFFLSPANDFHGRIGDLPSAVEEIQSEEWRVTCSPHHNHQDKAEYEVATQLWMDEHLKGSFKLPDTPTTTWTVATPSAIPAIEITPDESMPIEEVTVYYTTQGESPDAPLDIPSTTTRFWFHSVAEKEGDTWIARLPFNRVDRTVWVYANVRYRLDTPIMGAGYYYRIFQADDFVLSSLLQEVTPEQLNEFGVQPTIEPSLQIESFTTGWEKGWFHYRESPWERMTHKLNTEVWKAPAANVRLVLDVHSRESNRLVVRLDDFATEVRLGGNRWERIVLTPELFADVEGNSLADFLEVRTLKLAAADSLRPKPRTETEPRRLGGNWRGPPPEFKNLRWQLP